MIEIKGLSKSFGEVTALSDVSFSVPRGQIVGFLGANGAGKTTTMDILCGCLGPDTGTVLVGGYDVIAEPLQAKSLMGYLPDEPPLHDDMRVIEFINYAARVRGVTKAKVAARVEETMERLSLGDVSKRLVGNLSKGYRQRVGLAQAIVHDPELLVLDEPTEGLDPNQIVQIRELIKSLAGQHTILLSSHILSEVQNTCDHIIIINEGRVVEQGTYDDLVNRLGSQSTYNVRVARDVDRLADELRALDAVAAVREVNAITNSAEVELARPDTLLDDLAGKIVEGGYGLREISATARSLEHVFVKLTH